MDRFIARANLLHYRELLAKETDEAKRQQLLRLIAEEEIKLKSAERQAPLRGHASAHALVLSYRQVPPGIRGLESEVLRARQGILRWLRGFFAAARAAAALRGWRPAHSARCCGVSWACLSFAITGSRAGLR